MKRNYLFVVAILFVCAMGLLFSSTHVLDERSYTPAFSKQKTERTLEKNALPHLRLPKWHKDFFSQFAP